MDLKTPGSGECDRNRLQNLASLAELHCALHAAVLLERDVDYILRDGRVKLVDELTGRVAEDRHWPHGLQTALEAKEGLELQAEGRILGFSSPPSIPIRSSRDSRGNPSLWKIVPTAPMLK